MAGRLYSFRNQWLQTFGQCWTYSIIEKGYTPEWISSPPLDIHPISNRMYSQKDLQIYQAEIDSLTEIQAIREMHPSEPCFVSNLFLIPKKNGGLRPVIDLRNLNQYVKYSHFKMESIDLVKSLVRRGDFMISIDLNQAFYHVPLSPQQRKFFAFDFMGRRYCFNCLPFGLTASPRIFMKILKPIIKLARQKGIRIVVYLDDILIMASSKRLILEHATFVIKSLQNLGFTINRAKSSLEPSQVVVFLGFQINSKAMVLKLPRRKIKDLIQECKRV